MKMLRESEANREKIMIKARFLEPFQNGKRITVPVTFCLPVCHIFARGLGIQHISVNLHEDTEKIYGFTTSIEKIGTSDQDYRVNIGVPEGVRQGSFELSFPDDCPNICVKIRYHRTGETGEIYTVEAHAIADPIIVEYAEN